MCKICDKLINTPKNQESKVILKAYGGELTNYNRTFIEVYDEEGKRCAFISHEIQFKDHKTWSQPIHINYCPFCGQNLLKEEN